MPLMLTVIVLINWHLKHIVVLGNNLLSERIIFKKTQIAQIH